MKISVLCPGQEEGGEQPPTGGAAALLERLHSRVRGEGGPQGAPHTQEELQRHHLLVPALCWTQHAAPAHPATTDIRARPAGY